MCVHVCEMFASCLTYSMYLFIKTLYKKKSMIEIKINVKLVFLETYSWYISIVANFYTFFLTTKI